MAIIQTRLWIGGAFRDAVSGATFLDLNPEGDQPYAEASRASSADVELAMQAAHRAFAAYRETAPAAREKWLGNAAELLEARAEAFLEVLIDEIGSPRIKAQFELAYALAHLRAAAGIPRRICGLTLPSDTPGRFSIAIREPLGVFACITPFNVPLIKAMKQCTGPLATGNTVVTLASEHAPVLALRVAELFRDAGFPAGSFNVLTGFGEEIGDSLVAHPLNRGLNFTGSTSVGRHLSALCGRHFKRCLLELGGKSPLVILEDADLEAAVQGAVAGMFLYQGQVCMGSSRIIVQRAVLGEFIGRFKLAAEAVGHGDLRDPDTWIGPIISARQRARIQRHIDDAVARGATVVTGNRWLGNRCLPTILSGVTPDMRCYDEETFGPVAAVHAVDSVDAALELANDTAYGLSGAIYTRDLDAALRLARGIHAGMLHINAPSLYDEPHAPFGGVGDSGMGREGTVTDIDHCTEWKWITIQTPGAAHAPH